MKIKSIDTFTLEECQHFISHNPNSSDIPIVVKRMNYLLTYQDNGTTDIEYEDFIIKFRRLYVAQNFHDAFLLLLSSLRSSKKNRKEEICALGIKMLETNVRKIWRWFPFGGYGELKLDYDYGCNLDWLIDRAIEAQFTKVRIQNKGVVIGPFPSFSWHCYYLANKGENYSIRYSNNLFASKQDIDNMLKSIGKQLIKEAIKYSD